MLRTTIKSKVGRTQWRNLATAAQLSKYPIGLNIHGYTINDVKPIPEFSLIAVHLTHTSGSEHLHLDSENDHNNVFSVAFKTNPPNDTGVPHILEHTTLCGSSKYPVRDPFFKMTNRSLSNFMNAMTGHDYTFYPFATTNSKDFENLMDVYLSSVFEPLLTFNDFIQEGWRLENEDVNDKNSDLTLKGVVYNEMKGQMSNSSYYFYIKFLQSIYPSLHNSGGDPTSIPNLQYEDLVDFHSKHYHPSNAKTFTYGNLPLVNHLKRLELYISTKGKRKAVDDVKRPIEDFRQSIELNGPIDTMSNKPLDSQYKASITWNIGDALKEENQYKIFKWKILSSLLCDGHSSAFYQELIEKNIGDDFTPNTGFDITTALLSFSLGLNNINPQQVESLESKLIEIFEKNVIPEINSENYADRVEALLHQVELNFKKHKPEFGLGLLSGLIPNWINGVDPIKALQVENILNQFKEDFANNKMSIFQELIENDLLKNNQRFKFVMKPNENLNKDLADKENDRISTMVNNLDPADKDIIFNRGLALAKEQTQEQDCEVLPTLTMEDIPKQGEFYPIQHSKINDQELQTRIVDTNGLVYVNAVKDIGFIPVKYHKYLPLFTTCLTNLAGTTSTSITGLETKIQKYTGGISFGTRIQQDPTNIDNIGLQFSISGRGLKSNANHIYQLWEEILTSTRFDENDDAVVDKLSTLIRNLSQNQINVIADRGHSYSNSDSSSRLSIGKYISNMTGGISHVEFILDLNAKLESRGKDYLKQELIPILKEIYQLVRNNNGYKYRIVGDKNIALENEKLLHDFDAKLSSPTSSVDELTSLISNFNNNLGINAGKRTLINLPFQVGYTSLSKKGTEFVSKDGATLQILAQLLTFKHLHSVIRESNGAYGAGLNYDGLGGIINFYSYRDPNPLKSIESFIESFNFGKSIEWTSKDLQEAKLRIFQSIDAPINISSQGSNVFFDNITDEMRQQRRENFLETNTSDINNVIDKYLIGNPTNSITVIGDNTNLNVPQDWDIKELKV
jgi:Zn-dependent M16 (insulinase) family peptidase